MQLQLGDDLGVEYADASEGEPKNRWKFGDVQPVTINVLIGQSASLVNKCSVSTWTLNPAQTFNSKHAAISDGFKVNKQTIGSNHT